MLPATACSVNMAHSAACALAEGALGLQASLRGVPARLCAAPLLINPPPSLIFNCVDGLHLCYSVMQTLLYILSGLIVIRAENLIKPNNKGNCCFFFRSAHLVNPFLSMCCLPPASIALAGTNTAWGGAVVDHGQDPVPERLGI